MGDLHEFLFDVPATTTVRVRAASRQEAFAEIGDMQCLNWDLTHNQAVITELTLHSDAASLVEVDDKWVAGEERSDTRCWSEGRDGNPAAREVEDSVRGNGADRRDPTIHVSVADESVGSHEVDLNQDEDFICHDCAATGSTDGFTVSDSSAQAWHDSL